MSGTEDNMWSKKHRDVGDWYRLHYENKKELSHIRVFKTPIVILLQRITLKFNDSNRTILEHRTVSYNKMVWLTRSKCMPELDDLLAINNLWHSHLHSLEQWFNFAFSTLPCLHLSLTCMSSIHQLQAAREMFEKVRSLSATSWSLLASPRGSVLISYVSFVVSVLISNTAPVVGFCQSNAYGTQPIHHVILQDWCPLPMQHCCILSWSCLSGHGGNGLSIISSVLRHALLYPNCNLAV